MHNIADVATLVGADAVSTEPAELDACAHDCWPISHKQASQGRHPHRPDAVVRPRTSAQIAALLRWANTSRTPITPRGLGSSVTGAPLPTHGGVVLDLSALEGPLTIDETNLTVTVAASVRGDALEASLSERGYTLGHSPQSLHRSTVGGWLATRASGQFSSAYGSIEDLVAGCTVILPSGETVTVPAHPRAALGPDLRAVFIGSEGTLGVITEVTLRIFSIPEHRRLQAIRFSDVSSGLTAVREITQRGLRPHLVRLYDPAESRHTLADSSFDGCVLFLGFVGAHAVTEPAYELATAICDRAGGECIGEEPVSAWMERRFDFSTAESYLNTTGGYVETIEIAHTWSAIEATYRDARTALTPLADEVLGHFSHVYAQGTSLYLIVLGNLADEAAAEARIRDVWDATMRVAQQHGAALSHHHGVGLARLPYLADALGGGAHVVDAIKRALDPHNILNPGKLR